MSPEEFVDAIRKEVIGQTIMDYQGIYRDTDRSRAEGDPLYGPAFEIYDALPEEKRAAFMVVLRQAMVDTVSGVFAVLDGVQRLQSQDDKLVLQHGQEILSGDLQDLFLEAEEEA
jgi:hypothetical protein